MVLPEPIRLEMLDGNLTFTLEFGFEPGDERDLRQVVRTLLEPLLRRHRMTIIQAESGEVPWPPELISVGVSIGFNTRGGRYVSSTTYGQDAPTRSTAPCKVANNPPITAQAIHSTLAQEGGHSCGARRPLAT